ncbi:MAG: 16S rRNA (guanine(527)-N(7))-methyltransferase RsmG [Alphaproteobacteria bacterium]|nr:16S rRNA (guanine(527)-N(7))-methyltransferase RsmG [Alphaproteobacteria bacterium]
MSSPSLKTQDRFEWLNAHVNVSRETFEMLEKYVEQLIRWNQKINLIGPSTVDDIWNRHILDSLQLAKLIPAGAKNICDFGSGGGLPGLVLAFSECAPIVHLVESDIRKSVFLKEMAAFSTKKNIVVHSQRIEKMESFSCDVITARALAPLEKLVLWSVPFLHEQTECLFMKGQTVNAEIASCLQHFAMEYEKISSLSSAKGWIVRIKHVSMKK